MSPSERDAPERSCREMEPTSDILRGVSVVSEAPSVPSVDEGVLFWSISISFHLNLITVLASNCLLSGVHHASMFSSRLRTTAPTPIGGGSHRSDPVDQHSFVSLHPVVPRRRQEPEKLTKDHPPFLPAMDEDIRRGFASNRRLPFRPIGGRGESVGGQLSPRPASTKRGLEAAGAAEHVFGSCPSEDNAPRVGPGEDRRLGALWPSSNLGFWSLESPPHHGVMSRVDPAVGPLPLTQKKDASLGGHLSSPPVEWTSNILSSLCFWIV